MTALAAGLLGGAIGGGLAVTVLAPLTAANNFLGSYFFGSGMILGERQMYQDDWIKIKKRLDAGESFLVILEEVMKPNTQAVMQMARETVIAVSAEWNKIVLAYLQSIPQSIWDAINKISAGEAVDDAFTIGPGIIAIINGKVQCAAGWHPNSDKTACIKNTPSETSVIDTTPPPPPKKDLDVDTTIDASNKAGWQTIVGPGKTLNQIRSALQSFENLINQYYKVVGILKKDGVTKNRAKIEQLEKLIKINLNTRKFYQQALAWLSKQSGQARTP